VPVGGRRARRRRGVVVPSPVAVVVGTAVAVIVGVRVGHGRP
jgi:hypothetical protein